MTVAVIEGAVDNTEVVGVDDDKTAELVDVTSGDCIPVDVGFTNKEQITKHSVKFVKS